MYGIVDIVIDFNVFKRFYEEVFFLDKLIKFFDGLLYDFFFEFEREIIVGVILDWLN